MHNNPIKQVLEYTTVSLAAFPEDSFETRAQTEETLATLYKHVGNEPVIMEGERPCLDVLLIYKTLKPIATEIVYRVQADVPGAIVYSTYDDAQVDRPSGIMSPVVWTKTQTNKIHEQVKHDSGTGRHDLALDELWDAALREAASPSFEAVLKAYLTQIYQIAPDNKSIYLSGTVPIVPLLMTYEWFSFGSNALYYEHYDLFASV